MVRSFDRSGLVAPSIASHAWRNQALSNFSKILGIGMLLMGLRPDNPRPTVEGESGP